MRRSANRMIAGLSIIEYAVLIALVAAAVVTMQRYLVGALGGKWREAGDTFGGGQLCGPPQCPE